MSKAIDEIRCELSIGIYPTQNKGNGGLCNTFFRGPSWSLQSLFTFAMLLVCIQQVASNCDTSCLGTRTNCTIDKNNNASLNRCQCFYEYLYGDTCTSVDMLQVTTEIDTESIYYNVKVSFIDPHCLSNYTVLVLQMFSFENITNASIPIQQVEIGCKSNVMIDGLQSLGEYRLCVAYNGEVSHMIVEDFSSLDRRCITIRTGRDWGIYIIAAIIVGGFIGVVFVILCIMRLACSKKLDDTPPTTSHRRCEEHS
ncbi:unnamed protein product [Owenia fusiformis]|uniref:Uncharacterized protein n=1 Tax=Owenia fusiformis TaxID=6347 RepID=A0A8J1UCR5_OWEFU|nr:unnamed protein product [Owenia fusiformis]